MSLARGSQNRARIFGTRERPILAAGVGSFGATRSHDS
jgi:hypothetical protein